LLINFCKVGFQYLIQILLLSIHLTVSVFDSIQNCNYRIFHLTHAMAIRTSITPFLKRDKGNGSLSYEEHGDTWTRNDLISEFEANPQRFIRTITRFQIGICEETRWLRIERDGKVVFFREESDGPCLENGKCVIPITVVDIHSWKNFYEFIDFLKKTRRVPLLVALGSFERE
jgi:hypothetical protein